MSRSLPSEELLPAVEGSGPVGLLPMDVGALAAPPRVTFAEEVEAARSRPRDPAFASVDDASLVLEVRSRAAELASAKCAWLDAVAELVVRGIWADEGAKSPAQWLSWATGSAGSTARADVLVALRLQQFPHTHEVFARGLLSFSQVRAIVRCPHPEIEVELIRLATYCTGQELERLIGEVTAIQRRHQVDEVAAWERRALRHREVDDDLYELIVALPADEALRVRELFEHRAGLERKRIADARQQAIAAGADEADLAPVPSVTALTVDLMLEAMNAWLAREPEDATGQERHTLVLHVNADDLTDTDEDVAVPAWTESGRRVPTMSSTAIRRMLCDATWTAVSETLDGEVVELTGLTRTVPPMMRRLLMLRDRTCRYPGCGSRRGLHAHHIRHVEHGGATTPSNLVLLCGHHHRFVHAESVEILHDGRGRFRFQLTDTDTPMEPVLALLGADPDAVVRRREADDTPQPPPMSTHPDRYGLDLDKAVMHVLDRIGRAQPPGAVALPA